ncbi:MAG: thioredoxin domain-containing protein [Phycisphaerales bacterium]|nr:thioredoxin domain-containing protein [Phycisphaerales bacterium]
MPRLHAAIWTLGLVFIAIAIAASGALVLKHFTGVALPGCRAGSACDRLEQTIFGRILFPPGLAESLGFAKWPVSSLGFAFFVAIAAAWLTGLRWIAPGLKFVVRFGALFSLVYVGVIVAKQEWCRYCLFTHAANFGLLICMEVGLMLSKRSRPAVNTPRPAAIPSRRAGLASLIAFALAFFGATGVLGLKERGLAVAAAAELKASQEAILKASRDQAEKAAAQQAEKAVSGGDTYDFGPNGFTGRYRLGPEKAQVRIVIYGAYTCKYCKQMEQQALQIQAANPNTVSFCFKHFPMCWVCNKHTKEADTEPVHRNACWAARCAEACAIIAGANAEIEGKDRWTAANEAFWKAHHWLYDIDGQFDDKTLMDGLKAHGFDAEKVTAIMDKPAADKPVVSDIEEGHAIGLFQTPMIWINEVELKGWQVPGALQNSVNTLLGAKPALPALSAKDSGMKPPLAYVKAIEDWRSESQLVFMADTTARTVGGATAPVEVVIFGDFQEPNTAKADLIVRSWIYAPDKGGLAKDAASSKNVRYTFRHFPGDQSCNTKLPRMIFPQGCLASKSAETAGLMGGETAYWKMHDWLMKNQTGFGYDAAKRAAKSIGLETDAFVAKLADARVAEAIQNDINAAEAINVNQIPKIYIQGKWVRTWTREGDNVLERIADEAAKEAAKK